jgi:hypothetical protein
MKTSDFRAMRARFKDVADTFKIRRDKKPEELLSERKAAWNKLIDEFIRIEIPDKVELYNIHFSVPNPLAQKKLAMFEG